MFHMNIDKINFVFDFSFHVIYSIFKTIESIIYTIESFICFFSKSFYFCFHFF